MSHTLLDEVRARRPLPAPPVARSIRQAAGVSQSRMAVELGVDRMTVARWESGERKPNGANRDRYAVLLQQLLEVTP